MAGTSKIVLGGTQALGQSGNRPLEVIDFNHGFGLPKDNRTRYPTTHIFI
jgi:hypothetical protein